MTVVERHGPARWFKHLVGLGMTGLCLIVFLRQVNIPDLWDALRQFHWVYLVFGIVSLAVGYALRIVRWSMMLRSVDAKATVRNCCAPFLGSIALNNILPLRLGDVVRALVFPKSMGITRTAAISSLIVERLVDLMTLLVSLAVGLFAIRTIGIPDAFKTSAVTLAVVGGILLALGFFFGDAVGRCLDRLTQHATRSSADRWARVCSAAAGLFHGFGAMLRPGLLLSMFAISMLVWIGEAGLFYFVLLGVGVDGSPLVALLVMAMATLSTLVPSSPGYVGPFHLAAFTALSLVGGTAAQAGSYAVIAHLALWLFTTLAGAFAIWARPELFRAARSQAD